MMAKVDGKELERLLERCEDEGSGQVGIMGSTLEDIIKELQDYRDRDPEKGGKLNSWLLTPAERAAYVKEKGEKFLTEKPDFPDNILEDGHCITCGMRYFEG